MGIERKTAAQLQELKDTLLVNTHIEEVFFTDAGDHFFTAHELVEKGKRTGKFYGYQKIKAVQVKGHGDRRLFKHESVHTPATFITETLSREEVLAFEGADAAGKTRNLSPADKRK